MGKVKCLLWMWVCLCSVSCEQVNVALNKPTSTTSGTRRHWYTSGAVDGDHVSLNSPSSCFHSDRAPADWTVDLGQEYQLYNISFYLRIGGIGFEFRTANSSIYVNGDPSSACFTFPSIISDNPTHLTCNETARYVTIYNPGKLGSNDSLNICEVEIYACSAGYRGVDCEVDCHCDECNRWTGVCDSSCNAGWEGTRCDRECKGTYGSSCNNSCAARKCSNSFSSCDPVNGTCDPGCLAGYTGHDCITECPTSTYGLNCSQNCTTRYCEGNSTCGHVTGSCDQGCQPGWKSIDCREACNGTYGSNCINSCDDRHCTNSSSSCDSFNGTCDSGCQAGWTGHDCMAACPNSSYGLICSQNCTSRYCEGNSSCDHVTGSCDQGCQPGRKSIDCLEECSEEEEYGPNCSESCNARHCLNQSSCHQVTGVCEHGCKTGWEGLQCLIVSDAPRPYPGGGVIAGAAAAGVLVVLVLVLLAVLLIRRRRRQSTAQSSDSEPLSQANVRKEKTNQATLYENFALQEENSGDTEKRDTHKRVQVVQLVRETPEKTATENDKNGNDLGDDEQLHEDKQENEKEAEEDGEEEEIEDQKEILNDYYKQAEADEKNYYNLNQVDSKHVLPVSQLPERIKEMRENPLLVKDEYETLPREFLYSYEESQKKENKGKNRFKGYYPYDYNRVELGDSQGESDGDYINASFIDGYKTSKCFIAAQGPYKPELFEDFWRMVWQEECTAIVMVTSLNEAGKMKCLRYWPENVTEKYGRFTVTTEKKQQLADYAITNLVVQHEQHSKKRHIQHFYFTSWSDHGVPDISSLLTFMRRVQNSTHGQQQPIIVHCSAGIGRTGTYIAVESLVNRATTEGVVDVARFVTNMRGQRRNMVQTMEQYHFIYKAVSHAVTYGDTSLSVDVIKHLDLRQVAHFKMGNKTVEEHLKILQNVTKDEEHPTEFSLPSYRKRHGFTLVTPQADKETIWNYILNGDVRILITDSTCNEELFSSDSDVVFKRGRDVLLSEDVTMCSVDLTNQDGERTEQIQHYKVEGEMNEGTVSELTDSLLQGMGQTERQATAVITSSETKCGLLVLLVNLVSRLQEEGRTDIIQEMTRLQQIMPNVAFSMSHVRRCLEYSKRWIESIELYANI